MMYIFDTKWAPNSVAILWKYSHVAAQFNFSRNFSYYRSNQGYNWFSC